MSLKINAVLGMRGFYTFVNAQGTTVVRPAQVVEVHNPELVNIVVSENTYDNAAGVPVVDYRSIRVTEFSEVNAFSYKAEVAPAVETPVEPSTADNFAGATVPAGTSVAEAAAVVPTALAA